MASSMGSFVLDVADISAADISRVGGKNSSLGELFRALTQKDVGVLDGFVTTSDAYRCLLATGDLESKLRPIFTPFDPEDLAQLSACGLKDLRVEHVAYEFWTWSQSATRTIVSCSAQPISSPLQSPCPVWVDDVLGRLAERRSHRSRAAAAPRPIQSDRFRTSVMAYLPRTVMTAHGAVR